MHAGVWLYHLCSSCWRLPVLIYEGWYCIKLDTSEKQMYVKLCWILHKQMFQNPTQSCIVTEFNECTIGGPIFVTASCAARGTFLGTFPKLSWRRHEWLISHATRLPPHLLRITYSCRFLSLRATVGLYRYIVINTCTEKLHLWTPILDRSQGTCGIKLQAIAYV